MVSASEISALPLRDLPVKITIRAADFGARPDDGDDDLLAIQTAIERAAESGVPARVLIGPGRYDLFPAGDGGTALLIENKHDLILDGDGAELIIHNPKMGFISISLSRRVIVRELSADYDPLPFTQGWVRSVDDTTHSFEVEFASEFPLPDEEHFITAGVRWGILKDKRRPCALKPGTHNMCPLEGWEKVAGRRFRFHTADWYPMETIAPGDLFVQVARVDISPFASIWRSEDVTFERVWVKSSPGAGFVAQHCSRVNLLNCRIAPPEGRWQSVNADGFYCVANRVGPWVEGCVFKATGDDALVIKTWGANCIEKLNDRAIVLVPRPTWYGDLHPFAVEPGDRIRVCDPTSGQLLTEFKVVSVEVIQRRDQWPALRVRTDRDLKGIKPGSDRRSPIFYNDDMTGAGFVVRNNVFEDIRRWGLVCMSHDGLVEGNRFERTSAQAILMTSNDAGFRDSDGYVARNVTVRGNTFRECHTQQPAEYRAAAAAVTTVVIAGADREFQADIVEWQGHENILIEGNRFFGDGHVSLLWLGNVRRATVRGNVFTIRPRPGIAVKPAISLFNADAIIQDNKFVGVPSDRRISEVYIGNL